MSASFDRGVAAWPPMAEGDIAPLVAGLPAGERLTVIGMGQDRLGALLAASSDRHRGILLVACDGLPAAAILDRLLDDLADLALHRWPRWYGQGEPEQDDPVAAQDGAAPSAIPSDPWRRAAAEQAEAGRPPRFPRMARAHEFVRLLHAIDPSGVVLVWAVDPASSLRAGPVIEALEWCARHGAAVVAALAVPPPETAPYGRILYGARELVRMPVPASERFLAPIPGAHPASAVEQRVAAALAQDADLGDLFVCNAPVPVGEWGARPRVDLLCSAHRIVVELDGPEHRAEPMFGNDRHRDYELLTAGYLVLRLTNDQVATDLALAIEKIRAVVHLRRMHGESHR